MITVEEVSGRAALRRFFEFAYLTYRDEPRWSPPVVAPERARLDPQRNPFFDAGDGEYYLARRAGVVAGRITAHIAHKGDPAGWFGFFDAVDDPAVVHALVEQAAEWLREHGCTSMTGPVSFTVADGPGVLVDGFDVAGTTGRPWHPPWYATHLTAAGFRRVDDTPMWRLPAVAGPVSPPVQRAAGIAGRFADPRLVLEGIVAVPDLTLARGSVRTLARRSKRHEWNGCTVVELEGDPAVLVPRLQAAAHAAEYDWVITPWAPDDSAAPETIHARFTRAL